MKVAICVTTYRRPEGLERLLGSLQKLTFSGKAPELALVVVDNDAEASARALCEAWRQTGRWPLEYRVEATRGIPYGRNRAIGSLEDDVEFVAFIDDDEAAQPQWLDRLLAAQQRFAADVVAGPVEPVFGQGTPQWVVRGGFFHRPRYATGQAIEVAYTCNVLVRAAILRSMPQPFDVRFGLNGGDDSHLFRRLARSGKRMVWSDEALVREWIPDSRATPGWLLRRAFRTANALAFTEVDLAGSYAAYPWVALKGVVWMVLGGLLVLPAGLLLGRHVLVRGGRYVCYGAGLWMGLCGMKYPEYRQVHGG